MEDEIDEILDQYTREEDSKKEKANKNKFLTIEFYKSLVISFFMFFYLFFHSMIYPPKINYNTEEQQINQNTQRRNVGLNNTMNSLHMQRHGRYRSRGGG
jgi:hypothetical protein